MTPLVASVPLAGRVAELGVVGGIAYMHMKRLTILVRLGAFLAVAYPQWGHSQNPTNAYSWWEKKYAHLGKTTDEILGHAGSEHPHTILSALDYRIRQKRDVRGERNLTDTERRLRVIYWLDVEINNLEFKGYFLSSASDDVEAALAGLKEIGGTNAVAILERAMGVFPGGRPPGDRLKRREAVEQFASQAKSVWEQCVVEFYVDNQRLWDLSLAYAKKKRAEILLP